MVLKLTHGCGFHLLVLTGALFPLKAFSQDAAPVVSSETKSPAAKRPLLKYVPPKSDSSGGTRIDGDGGARGVFSKNQALYVIAPNGAAYTTQKQPSLFYYQMSGLDARAGETLSFSIVVPNQSKPLLKAVAENAESGLRRIQISRYGVELASGVRYEWKLALSEGGEGKSKDTLASGSIEYKEASEALKRDLAEQPENQAAIYAAHGIWYDAFEALSSQILKDPKNPQLLAQRVSLLKQIQLETVAAKLVNR
ncbi:MAG: DUF928 domain-containing protein [Verrucomicrobia bacterium]|nr:DUF928 domain-containing protein [Verrucomicrobiota bacterium]